MKKEEGKANKLMEKAANDFKFAMDVRKKAMAIADRLRGKK